MEKENREKREKERIKSNSTSSVVAANVSEQWKTKSFLSVIFNFQL